MSMHTSLRRSATTISSSTSSFLPTQSPSFQIKSTTFICSQCRHATLLRRPKRPYTFTQLVTLSDGSAFTHRTTSPAPVYRATRDTRNSLLWNPSSSKLMNVEEDEAGRLAAFRARFGRSWDASAPVTEEAASTGDATQDAAAKKAEKEAAEAQAKADQEEEDNLLDLISSFGQDEPQVSGKKKKY